MVRDSEGFLRMIHRDPSAVTIGQYRLIHKEAKLDDWLEDRVYNSGFDRGLGVEFPNKAWQAKAWAQISRNLNYKRKPAFLHRTGSRKLKHLLRIGVSLRVVVYPDDGTLRGPQIARLEPPPGQTGSYYVAETGGEIIDLLNAVYKVAIKDRPEYQKILDANNQAAAGFITKCMIVYDDRSYDTVTSRAVDIFKLLDVKFNKYGRVML